MGYDLHITRAEHWLESEETPIQLEEWLAVVKADPEFKVEDSDVDTTHEGASDDDEGEVVAVWVKYSKNQDGRMAVPFRCHDGEISVKNADEEIIGKIRSVAKTLQARVQGDDGEYYDE